MTEAIARSGRWRWERREPIAWALIVLAAAALRLYDLGTRVMSHDESLHAFNAFELFVKGVYRHDPAYHGPLLYHINAVVYYLFGATDFTARLAPALTGTLLVAGLWMFRPYLGRAGAAAAAALIAVSPSLLFYSRYIREDIYIAFFTLAWVYGAFRYLDGRRSRWLFVIALAMALSFITKESSFISGAVIGSFFALRAILPARNDGASSRAASLDLAVLMVALVLPFTTGPVYVALGWDPLDRDPGSTALLRGAAVAGGFVLLAALLMWWRFRAAVGTKVLALFWGIQVVFFTGFFTNPVGGLVTGVAGSVGYWLGQHEVGRGSQPWFYYLIVGGLYEFLVILVSVPAMMVVARRLRTREHALVPADDLPIDPAPVANETRRLFFAFTLWWTVGSWITFGWAGERMPWLLTHQVLPLMLLSGWAIGRLVRVPADVSWAATARLAGTTAIVLVVLTSVLAASPFTGRDLASVARTARWWVAFLLLAALVPAAVVYFRRAGRRQGLPAVALGILLVLGFHTLRASVQLAFVNYDLATEILSYAQASPDVRRVMGAIDAISERTVGAHQVRVAYDDESTWPLVWYLRNYPNARTWGTRAELAQSAPIILAGGKNLGALQPYVSAGYERRTYVLYWWPLQGYANLRLSTLWDALADPGLRQYLWRVFSRRDYGVPLSQWPLRREIQMFVRSDVAALAGPSPAGSPTVASPRIAPTAPPEPIRALTGPYDGLPLRNPTALAVGADGAWLVADGGNDRVVVLEPDGSLRMVVGKGQLDEPWGVAPGPGGDLFVADTWNGRIQVFDRRGALIRSWGKFGQIEPDAAPGETLSLYGPRGLVVDEEDHLVVADTGNKRLLVFDVMGKLVSTVGGGGAAPVFFDEPTSLARDANHTLLVADAWHQRIVRLDNRRHAIGSWSVPGWRSRSAEDKPSVAVDAAGFVYASDPENARVLVFTASGELERIVEIAGSPGEAARPTGVAIDPVNGQLLVLDHRGGRLLVYPQHTPDR